MRGKFCLWYAAEVFKQLEKGMEPENVTVDTRMSVMKEINAKWIVGVYDYLRSKPNLNLIVYCLFNMFLHGIVSIVLPLY